MCDQSLDWNSTLYGQTRRVLMSCTSGPVKVFSSTFQTHFVQLIEPSQVFVRPTGIQTLPSPVNSTIISALLLETCFTLLVSHRCLYNSKLLSSSVLTTVCEYPYFNLVTSLFCEIVCYVI